MKRVLIIVAALLALAAVYLYFFPFGQQRDRSFDARIAQPAFTAQHPVMLFDEAHYNAHSAVTTFRPFADLMRNDGFEIRRNREPFTARTLQDVKVLTIVNASGGSNPKLFGINLQPLRKGKREAPAFTASEIAAVRDWVASGGSLLLVADHYPFGSASAALASAFGVTMHCGYVDVPEEFAFDRDRSAVNFTRANALLGDHPITRGINRVVSFTGQSLDATNGVALLRLPPNATEDVPPPPNFKSVQAGSAQGVAIEFGRGRVVVLGEAAMLSAQVSDGRKFGMNVEGVDNRQFALNVVHWLARTSMPPVS